MNRRRARAQNASAAIIAVFFCIAPALFAETPVRVSIPGREFVVDGKGARNEVVGSGRSFHGKPGDPQTILRATVRMPPGTSGEQRMLRLFVRLQSDGPWISSVEIKNGSKSELRISTRLEARRMQDIQAIGGLVKPLMVNSQSVIILEISFGGAGIDGGVPSNTNLLLDSVIAEFQPKPLVLPGPSTTVKPPVFIPNVKPAPPVPPAASVPNIPHSQGVIYIVNDANALLWYRHDGRADGSFKWANDGSAVGHGWDFRTVLGGGDGVMYAVTREGDLIWYRHTGGGDGSFHWAQDKGQTVNSGFSGMAVVAAGNGVLYALNHKTGELLWYRHEGYLDGTDRWVAREGRVIASDWRGVLLFAGDAGTLYAIARGGDLYRFRYDGRADGSGTLPFAQGQKIASNWNHYLFPFSAGDGIIYALSPEHQLLWFRDEGYQDGTVHWEGEPKVVGVGWQFRTIFSGATLAP